MPPLLPVPTSQSLACPTGVHTSPASTTVASCLDNGIGEQGKHPGLQGQPGGFLGLSSHPCEHLGPLLKLSHMMGLGNRKGEGHSSPGRRDSQIVPQSPGRTLLPTLS